LQKNRQPSGADANSYLSHIGTSSMPYSEAAYANTSLNGMPSMPAMPTDAYGDGLPSMNAPQSMSARTSRSNSLIRPGTGIEENRRSMSSLDMGNNRINFNEYRGTNGMQNNMHYDINSYGTQQNHAPSASTGAYQNGYDNAMHAKMNQQNSNPIKTEDTNSASYARPTLPNVEGLSNGQDNTIGWNGNFNGEPQDQFSMASSMASGPHPGKSAGVLTGNV
jgi:hypothetical protein